MDSGNHMSIDIADGVQTIRFARPDKKNAITMPMYQSMAQALRDGDAKDEVRVNLFAGAPGCFTAGNDINDFIAAGGGNQFGVSVFAFLEALVKTEKPMIAAVDGDAIGIGTTMLFHMDLVYASPAALFRTPFLDLGLVPEGGSSLLMPRVMGHARAFEMLCLGKAFSAEQALSAGFVNDIIAADELEPSAKRHALRLASKPPEALRLGRRLLKGGDDELLARIREEGRLFIERLTSGEAREAFQAFIEKRAPDFSARG